MGFDTEVDVVDRQECQTVKVPKHVSMPVVICDEMPEQKCETKYAEECHTEYEKECHDTPFTDCQTVEKPVTKYRDEEECKTVYDQVCIPSYEESCHTVTERQCKTVTETECDHNNRCWDEKRDECRDEPRQECKQTPKKVCNNVPRQKCNTVQHPYTDYEDKQECSTTNKPVCRQVPVNKCYDVETPVNHIVPGSKCQNKPKKVCQKVPKQECKDVPRRECNSVPKKVCHTAPRRVCHTEYNQITSYEDNEGCKSVQDKVDRKVARQVCYEVPRKECRQVPVTKTVFKDDRVCKAVAGRQCTKVSRRACTGPSMPFYVFEDSPVTQLPCCREEDETKCRKISLNAALLGRDEIEILDQTVKFEKMAGYSGQTYRYINKKLTLSVTYNAIKETFFAQIDDYSNDDAYTIEACDENTHILRSNDKKIPRTKDDILRTSDDILRTSRRSRTKRNSENETVDEETEKCKNECLDKHCCGKRGCECEDKENCHRNKCEESCVYDCCVEKWGEDKECKENCEKNQFSKATCFVNADVNNHTMATYTANVYYTPQVAEFTYDMDTFIQNRFDETNEGYINSNIRLELKLHCLELRNDLDENLDDTPDIKLESADVAIWVGKDMDAHGYANWNKICNKSTISWIVKASADVDETLIGHEIGHNIGLCHDVLTEIDNGNEPSPNPRNNYGWGYLFGRYSTIMAYTQEEAFDGINMYSSPDLMFDGGRTGTLFP